MRVGIGPVRRPADRSPATKEVESVESRGEATIRNIAGKVDRVAPRRRATLGDIGALKLTANGTDVKLSRVRGDATIQARAGEIDASELEGAVDIEGNNTDITVEGARGIQGSGPCHRHQRLGADSRRAHRDARRRAATPR